MERTPGLKHLDEVCAVVTEELASTKKKKLERKQQILDALCCFAVVRCQAANGFYSHFNDGIRIQGKFGTQQQRSAAVDGSSVTQYTVDSPKVAGILAGWQAASSEPLCYIVLDSGNTIEIAFFRFDATDLAKKTFPDAIDRDRVRLTHVA